MDFSELPILRTIFPMSLAGMVIGVMVGLGRNPPNKNEIWYYIAGSAVLFGWLGWLIVQWKVRQSLTIQYQSETPAVIEKVEHVTLVITVNGSRKLIHGFSRDALQAIGACVTDKDLYQFNVQHFKDYFGATEHNGYSLYTKVVRWMQDCNALAANSKGGWDVTEHIGKQVFDAMRDEAWEEIEELPHPSA